VGYRNGVFGGKLDRYIVGPQGLGKINQSVQMLTDFYERNVTGIKSLGEGCTHGKNRRSKSKSPGLYIFVNQPLRNNEKTEQISDMACSEC
jgi:hypothetical protein